MDTRPKSSEFHTYSHNLSILRINKHLRQIFLLTFFVTAFLASCSTNAPASSTLSDSTLNLDDCPDDQLTLVADVNNTFDWVNPSGQDFTITSIVITAAEGTVNEDLPELTRTSTSTTLPEGSYTITITATSTAEPITTDTCSFDVTVGLPTFEVSCPEGAVPLTLTSTGIILSATNSGVTAQDANNENSEVTWGFVPARLTETDLNTSVTVRATATDTAGSANACDFTVTVNPAGTPEFTTACPADITTDLNTGNTANVSWTAPEAVIPDSSDTITYSATAISAALISGTATGATPSFTTQEAPSTADFPVGVSTVTITATNANAPDSIMPVSCSFTVTVQPTVTLMCEVTTTSPMTAIGRTTPVEWRPTVEVAGVNNPTPTITYVATATDASLPPPPIDDNATSAGFPIGSFTVMATTSYTLTDEITDMDECSFMITVSTATAPTGSLFILEINTSPPSDSNPFLIQNANDLMLLATAVNENQMYTSINQSSSGNYREANYILTDNISFDASTENNFTPIGIGRAVIMGGNNQLETTCDDTCFQGTFDGSSNTISGLHFSNDNRTNLGLFSVISGSSTSISNLILTGINITGNRNIGGLVGTMINSSSLSNVSIAGFVNGLDRVGGLVGQMNSMSRISNAAAASTANDSSSQRIGGLVGEMNNSSITNAFASGTVLGFGFLGGLVGNMSSSSVTNAYASGTVTAQAASAGGLVNSIGSGSTVRNTLAWGNVSVNINIGITLIGGLVATVSRNINITNSYWDNTDEGTGQDISAGSVAVGQSGATPSYLGYTTTQLQMPTAASTTENQLYFEWSNDIWDFGATDQYPALSAQDFPVTVACQRTPTIGCPNYNTP